MIGMDLQFGGPARASYTVEHRGDCVLVFGGVPAAAVAALAALVPRESIMDCHLARLAGCSLAMGLAEDTKALSVELTPIAIERTHVRYRGAGLSEAALHWLAVGRQGSSSIVMFAALSGVTPSGLRADDVSHPRDPDDLSRCRLLLEQVPELATNFERLAAVSPVWQQIVAIWDPMCALMDSECPDWRTGRGLAPGTAVMLREVTTPTRRREVSL